MRLLAGCKGKFQPQDGVGLKQNLEFFSSSISVIIISMNQDKQLIIL